MSESKTETKRTPIATFFNELSLRLNITMTSLASHGAKIESINASVEKFTKDNNIISISLTEEDWKQNVYNKPSITLTNYVTKTFRAPEKKSYFSTRDLVDVLIAFEKIDRARSNWFDRIDVHHIYFEGLTQTRISKTRKVAFTPCWGS